MKLNKYFVLLLMAVMFGICIIASTYYSNKSKHDYYRDNQMIVFSFQDCEYIKYKDCIIHKGNCTNSIHAKSANALIKAIHDL